MRGVRSRSVSSRQSGAKMHRCSSRTGEAIGLCRQRRFCDPSVSEFVVLCSSSLVPGSAGGTTGPLICADGARGCVAGCCTIAPRRCLCDAAMLSKPEGAPLLVDMGSLSGAERPAFVRIRAS